MNTLSKKVVIGTVAVATISASGGAVWAHDASAKAERATWRQIAHQALESGDYPAWLAAQRQAFDRRTNQERFEKLQTFHHLLADGRHAEATAFAKEHHLGIGRHHRGLKHRVR